MEHAFGGEGGSDISEDAPVAGRGGTTPGSPPCCGPRSPWLPSSARNSAVTSLPLAWTCLTRARGSENPRRAAREGLVGGAPTTCTYSSPTGTGHPHRSQHRDLTPSYHDRLASTGALDTRRGSRFGGSRPVLPTVPASPTALKWMVSPSRHGTPQLWPRVNRFGIRAGRLWRHRGQGGEGDAPDFGQDRAADGPISFGHSGLATTRAAGVDRRAQELVSHPGGGGVGAHLSMVG